MNCDIAEQKPLKLGQRMQWIRWQRYANTNANGMEWNECYDNAHDAHSSVFTITCLANAKHIWDCATNVSHHIHNFTHKCYFFPLFLFLSSSLNAYLLHFFRKHFDSVKPQALFYYTCFLLYFISVIWWPVAALDSLLSCVCGLFFAFTFSMCAYGKYFHVSAKFCALTKELHIHHHKAYFSYTQNCWSSSSSFPKKWNTKSLWYVFNYERKRIFTLILTYTYRERERDTYRWIHALCPSVIHIHRQQQRQWQRQRQKRYIMSKKFLSTLKWMG